MPIYPGSDMSILRPGGVSKCRPTRVRATGTATAYNKTGPAALREARAETRRLCDKAVRRLRDRGCPRIGGCAAGCQQGRILRIAWGTRLDPPRPRAGMWYASAAEYHVLLVNCRCPE
jgi:hypothetical protein